MREPAGEHDEIGLTNTSMLTVENLTKRYGDQTVVDGVSFGVAKGELLALVGGSGSGKTTTLKMINRLIEPTSGRVIIDGQDTSGMAPHLLRRSIGYVSQKVGLFPHMTVAENIAVTPMLLGVPREQCAERALALLDLVELDRSFVRRYPTELSGGQQQRVGVARALAAEPRLMLLDEPFGALDPLTRDRLQQSFTRIRENLGFTAVFVTHDINEAFALADHIAILRESRLVQFGTAHALLTAPCDEYVERLLDTPRRQAQAFERAMRGAPS